LFVFLLEKMQQRGKKSSFLKREHTLQLTLLGIDFFSALF